MKKLLYITDGIFPAMLGGMQKVSSQHIQMLSSLYNLSVIYSGVELSEKIPGVNYIFEPWPKESGPFLFNKYPYQLRRFSANTLAEIERIKPDVVYSEGPLVDKLLDRKKHNFPVIFHPHGLEPFQRKGALIDDIKAYILTPIVRKHCLGADIVLSQGGKLDEILINKIGVNKRHIRHLQNVFNFGSGSRASEKDVLGKKYDLIFVGRNEKRKGLEFLLNTINKRQLGLSIGIVGNHDNYRKKYLDNDNFHWLGEISDSKTLYSLYRKSKFLILPSFAEGMPTVLLEAMSQGVPAIASDVGAVKQVVINGNNGIIFESGNSNSLLSAIEQGLNVTNAKYEEMSKAALNCVKKEFEFDVVKEKLASIVNDALSNYENNYAN